MHACIQVKVNPWIKKSEYSVFSFFRFFFFFWAWTVVRKTFYIKTQGTQTDKYNFIQLYYKNPKTNP